MFIPSDQSNELYLDVRDSRTLETILAAPRFMLLIRLAIPGAALFARDKPNSALLSIIQCVTILKQIMLLNVWEINPLQSFQLDTVLDSQVTPEDLVIGTWNPNSSHYNSRGEHLNTKHCVRSSWEGGTYHWETLTTRILKIQDPDGVRTFSASEWTRW